MGRETGRGIEDATKVGKDKKVAASVCRDGIGTSPHPPGMGRRWRSFLPWPEHSEGLMGAKRDPPARGTVQEEERQGDQDTYRV